MFQKIGTLEEVGILKISIKFVNKQSLPLSKIFFDLKSIIIDDVLGLEALS